MEMENHIRLAYDLWAKEYDRDSKWNPAIQMERGRIIPLLDPRNSDTILEIGCGTGRLTIPIARMCKSVVGVDFSECMLEVANRKSEGYKNIQYVEVDARKRLPFQNASFDKVVGPLLTNHIKNIQRFFNEVYRILKPNGVFVFDDPSPDSREIVVKHHSVLDDMSDQGKRLFFIHSIDAYVHSLHRSNFEVEQIRFARFDDRIRHLITSETFRKNKGHTAWFIIKTRKQK
jgi:ubiquinone/menaquinone biosynthesis C-methylase UbiE